MSCPSKLAIVILAAGKGTRMKSDLPKVLHQVQGESMIERVVQTANRLKPDQIVIVVGHQAHKVQEHLQQNLAYADYPLHFVTQKPQLGTGHAVQQAQLLLMDVYRYGSQDQVMVLSGDVPLLQLNTLQRLVATYRQSNTSKAVILTAQASDPTGFGRIVRQPTTGLVMAIIEEKDITEESVRQITEINTGTYLFQAEALFTTLPQVQNNNRQQEYYLPDVVKIWTAKQEPVRTCMADFQETQGVNTPAQLAEVSRLLVTKLTLNK